MKKTIFYFLILLLAVWLGSAAHQNPGYVLIAYHNVTIETSLWFAVVSLIVLFLIFHMLLRFGSGVSAITSYIKQWVSNRRKRRAHSQTVLGLYDLIEGNWERAEKKLFRSAKYSDMPVVNYLAAALMAQNQYEFKRRDNYLKLAQKAAKNQPITSGLIQANLQIKNHEWKDASVILQDLHQQQPKNIFILQLLHRVFLELKDWKNLENLLPLLRKRNVLDSDTMSQLEQQVYKELLLANVQNHSIDIIWRKLPRYLQKNPTIVAVYSEYLLANNQTENAESILKMCLRKILDKHLLELYAVLPSSQPIKQLTRTEEWLKDNPKNADLLLCLGRLCKKQKLWGKARNYLERSAKLSPSMSAYAELAQISSEQNDLRGALDFYAKGMRSF